MQTGDPRYFNRYAYTANDPINLIDPTGEAFGVASKVIKVAIKGGDVGAVLAGGIADAKVLTGRNVSLGRRLMAGGSLVTEIFSPVSARDAKAITNGAARTIRNAKNGREGKRFQTAVGEKNSLTPNTKTFDTNVQKTIPDFKNVADVGDAKSVKSLSDTRQMRSQRDLAESNGGTHTVYLNADKNPKISGPMERSSTVVIMCRSDGTPC